MRLGTLAVVVLPVLLATLSASAEIDARRLLGSEQKIQAGRKSFDAGDLVGARKQYEKALELVPFHPEALLGLGHILMKEKRFDDALASYQKAKDGYAALAKLRQDQAAAADLARRQGVEDLEQTQANRGRVKASGGFARMQDLKTDTAIQNSEKVPTPDGERAAGVPGEAFFYTGTALFQLGRVEEAVAEWTSCAEKSPDFAPAFNNLALGYWKLGRLKDAIESLARAEKLGFKVNPQFKSDLQKAASKAGVAPIAGDLPLETPAAAK
ncbi:MAG: tetratricopeptide repeat protein [Acidobacteriia bacterium]|nr:tetratricopeptide repeat protein [Terriglobia bacterium]